MLDGDRQLAFWAVAAITAALAIVFIMLWL